MVDFIHTMAARFANCPTQDQGIYNQHLLQPPGAIT